MAINGCIEQKEKEILVVVEPNTVVNPWTMMVHLKDAHSADPAVVAPIWLVLMAPFAMTSVASAFLFHCTGFRYLLITIPTIIDPFWIIRDTSRVHHYTADVTEK